MTRQSEDVGVWYIRQGIEVNVKLGQWAGIGRQVECGRYDELGLVFSIITGWIFPEEVQRLEVEVEVTTTTTTY